jgi:hypothetical protein
MRLSRLLPPLLLLSALGATRAAADWTPAKWAATNTLELRTTRASEGEHWSTVWLVVLDDQVYVRLGTRAAARIADNTTAPLLDVRIDGQQFRVKGVDSPSEAERVARAMGEKYWSDVFVKYFSHPMTLKLVPAD